MFIQISCWNYKVWQRGGDQIWFEAGKYMVWEGGKRKKAEGRNNWIWVRARCPLKAQCGRHHDALLTHQPKSRGVHSLVKMAGGGPQTRRELRPKAKPGINDGPFLLARVSVFLMPSESDGLSLSHHTHPFSSHPSSGSVGGANPFAPSLPAASWMS